MLRRISEICNVGNFYEFRDGGKCQFEKMTLIYGLNTYGKSTIVDVLNSLSTNDPMKILDKKSIGGNSTGNPKIKMSFADESGKENHIFFNQCTWQGFQNNYQIEVFDSKYIAKNVFTGLDITRDNKLNITEFILGEENVVLANEISELKKKRREKTSELKGIEKNILDILSKENKTALFPKGKVLEGFLRINVSNDYHGALISLRTQKEQLENTIKHSQKILNMQCIDNAKVDIQILDEFYRINKLLNQSYDDINNEAFEKIISHLKNTFSEVDSGAENWIKEGTLKYFKENENGSSQCPYCGQFIHDFSDLIFVYKKYFSEAYTQYSEQLIAELRKLYKEINERINIISNNNFKDFIIKLKGYYEFISDKKFKEVVEGIESCVEEIGGYINTYTSELCRLLEEVKGKAKRKKEKPYDIVECIKLDNVENIIKDMDIVLTRFNATTGQVNLYITEIKGSVENNGVIKELKKVDDTISKLELEALREKWKNLCENYLMISVEYDDLKKLISDKQENLKKAMDAFLRNYFDQINYYLKIFGTKNIQIEEKIATNGDMPVISLNVKFKGYDIEEKNLKNIFSESDMRALALSIFWAKLVTKSELDLSKTIIILDDPVTSFDCNRIRATINEVFKVNEKCKQTIILSHFEAFVTILLNCHNGNCSLKIIRIGKNHKTSYLENCDFKEFLFDDHDKLLEKIDRFIASEIDEDISKDLRVYFENEVRRRYRYPIIKLNIENTMMKDLLIKLTENHIIDESTKNKILDFLRILNPEHHTYTQSNNEEWRTIAEEILKFLFNSINNSSKNSSIA